MRAWGVGVGEGAHALSTMRNAPHAVAAGTHPHLRPLDLPLIPVALVSPPFGLEVVEDAGERVILAALGDLLELGILGALLLLGGLGLLLLLLLARRGLFGTCEGAQHGELDRVVVVLSRRWFRAVDSQRRAVDHRDLFGTNNASCRLYRSPGSRAVFTGLLVVDSRENSVQNALGRVQLQARYFSPPAARHLVFLKSTLRKASLHVLIRRRPYAYVPFRIPVSV